MSNRITFSGESMFERYVLASAADGTPNARSAQLGPDHAVRIVLAQLRGRYGQPDWRVLRLLEIREHPANLAPSELSALVTRRVGGAHPHFRVYREAEQHVQMAAVVPAVRPSPSAPAQRTKLDFFSLQLVDEAGRAIPQALFELTFANGDSQMAVTGMSGAFLLDNIAPGTCGVALEKVSPPPRRQTR